MRVIELRAENYKRLKAIRWCPGPHLNEVAGLNAQGKSSLLDSIYVALGGKKVDCQEPIRRGERSASVELLLGDIRVRRTWTESGSYLAVEDQDGSNARSPQAVLDSLASHLGLDPVRFSMMADKDQIKTLVDVFGLDTGHLDRLIDAASESRKEKSRDAKKNRAAAERIQVKDGVDVAEMEATVELLNSERKRLQEELERVSSGLVDALAELANCKAFAQKQELIGESEFLEYEVEKLDREIGEIRRLKRETLSKIGSLVPGLEIGEDTLLYQGVPFSQASSSQRILVGLAVAAASNPAIRLVLVRDASLIDDETMKKVEEIAERENLQILVERVGGATPGRYGVLISDGEAVAKVEPEGAPAATGKHSYQDTIEQGRDLF